MTQQPEMIWSIDDCAKFLGVSKSYLHKNYRKYPHLRINRHIKFIPGEVAKYLKRIQKTPQ